MKWFRNNRSYMHIKETSYYQYACFLSCVKKYRPFLQTSWLTSMYGDVSDCVYLSQSTERTKKNQKTPHTHLNCKGREVTHFRYYLYRSSDGKAFDMGRFFAYRKFWASSFTPTESALFRVTRLMGVIRRFEKITFN